jgi:hypothetical protein
MIQAAAVTVFRIESQDTKITLKVSPSPWSSTVWTLLATYA